MKPIKRMGGLLCALMFALTVGVVSGADVVRVGGLGVVNTAVQGVTVASGSATNLNVLLDCTKGEEVFVEVSYYCSTNYQNTAAYGTKTNLTVAFKKTMGVGSPDGGNSAVGSDYIVPELLLVIPGNTITNRYWASTNITMKACPYLKLVWATNDCGLDSNTKLTNLTVNYYIK